VPAVRAAFWWERAVTRIGDSEPAQSDDGQNSQKPVFTAGGVPAKYAYEASEHEAPKK
jgi:hypothetical protein